MFNYKVEYVETTRIKGKWWESKSQVDGLGLSKEVEAHILERDEEGYELVQLTPIVASHLVNSTYPMTRTDGLLLTFRKKTDG